MDFKKFLGDEKAQKQIDKLAKKYKNKKVVVYGAGKYANCVFENYDLSKLNIVAVADRKFSDIENHEYYGIKGISPDDLREFDCDVILLGVYDVYYFVDYLKDELLCNSKNEKIEIKPIVKQSFFRFVKSLFSGDEE